MAMATWQHKEGSIPRASSRTSNTTTTATSPRPRAPYHRLLQGGFKPSHANAAPPTASRRLAAHLKIVCHLPPGTSMVNAASAAGIADLFAGIMALEIFFILDPQSGAGAAPSAQAPLLDSALDLLLPLGVAGVLFTAVAFIYRHLSRRHAAVPAAGAANRLLSGVVFFILCVSVGVLDFFFFVVQPAGGVDHGARARALGLAAHGALPTAATATFFWGMMLIIIAHVRAGGEGAVAGAGNGAILGSLRLFTKIAVGAAAGLVSLVIAAFCIEY